EELKRQVLAKKLRRNISSVSAIMAKLHSTSEFSSVAYNSVALRVERSRQMLGRVNDASGALKKTIYKVGNHHVLDMREKGWARQPGVRIFTKEEYLLEYQSLKGKKTTAPTVFVSGSTGGPGKSTSTPITSSPSLKHTATLPTPVLTERQLPSGWAKAATS